MLGFVLHVLIVVLGLWISTKIVPGVSVDGNATLFLAGLTLGIANAVVRPVVVLLTLPLTLLTLGLFLFVVNAAMVGLTAVLLDGFVVPGFWPALWVSVVTGLTSWIVGGALLNAR